MSTEAKFHFFTGNTRAEHTKTAKSSSSPVAKTTLNFHHSKIVDAAVSPAVAVPNLPIYVDENNVIEGAKEILSIIRPNWNLNVVQFKKFTDGITNKLVGCFYAEAKDTADSNDSFIIDNTFTNGVSRSVDDNDSGNLSDGSDCKPTRLETNDDYDDETTESVNNVVLIRVYGNKTDLLIDRKAETKNIILLHSYGFAPTLYATFKNGLVYDFVPGVTLNPSNVLRSDIWPLVARRMAEMHRVVQTGPTSKGKAPIPMLWKKVQRFFNLIPERFSDAEKHSRLAETFLPITRLRVEFESLYRHLETLGSPLVFAHNDLLLGNVIYTESLQCVTFIDYEYADYNFQAFDIGNHFAEFAGVDEVNYELYPGREFQYEWLRIYLQTYLHRTYVSEAEVHRLYVEVNQFVLASHLFWTLWCLIQAEHSNIDFDYVDYAFVRYREYLAKKDIFLALDVNRRS